MQSSQAIQHLSPGKHRKISTPWIYNGILNTQPAAPNTGTYPHRCCLFPPCKNKHSHDKGWAWWWKAVELYICFLMGYFQNFSLFSPFFYPNKVIPASLPHFFCIFFHLILSFAVYFLKTHTHTHTFRQRSVQLLHPSCFYIPTTRHSLRTALGCLPPPAVFRGGKCGAVCVHVVCLCVCMRCVGGGVVTEGIGAWMDNILERQW